MKTVLWDFDGVIVDSNKVRDLGFKEIFKNFDKDLVDDLIAFHRKNGGLSRYVKIRYFFEELLEREVTEEGVLEYAQKFSVLMRRELTNSKYLILDSVDFIKCNHHLYNFHIVSGSDQEELRYLVKELGIDKYFISINGSPIAKTDLVIKVLKENNYDKKHVCLIGDSFNDYEAAQSVKIKFFGYNNDNLRFLDGYLNSLVELKEFRTL